MGAREDEEERAYMRHVKTQTRGEAAKDSLAHISVAHAGYRCFS